MCKMEYDFLSVSISNLHSLTGNSWKSLMSSIRMLRSLILSAKPAAM